MEETDVNQVPVSEGADREVVQTQPQVVREETTPGSKTDSALLLKSLQEEREKRRLLEERVQNLESSSPSENQDEDLSTLRQQLASVQAKQAKAEVLEAYPQLKEAWPDFEEFRNDPDNKGMNLRTAAKAFVVEKGLNVTPRIGLEKPTGGQRTPLQTGMTAEEVKHLRETDFRKYSEMLQKGQIKVS